MSVFSSAFCLPPPPFRKPIVPQKEPSPLLEKKIQHLEAKFAELEGGDEDMEEMGEEEGDMTETPSMPQLQTPLASELDIMPYTPPQVRLSSLRSRYTFMFRILSSTQISKETVRFHHIHRRGSYFSLRVYGINYTERLWHIQYDIQVTIFKSIKMFLKEIIQLRKIYGTFLYDMLTLFLISRFSVTLVQKYQVLILNNKVGM